VRTRSAAGASLQVFDGHAQALDLVLLVLYDPVKLVLLLVNQVVA